MTERRQQERRTVVGCRCQRGAANPKTLPQISNDRVADRRQASGAARNVAPHKVQDETVPPMSEVEIQANTSDSITADKSVEYSRPEQSAASCETTATGEGRQPKNPTDDVYALDYFWDWAEKNAIDGAHRVSDSDTLGRVDEIAVAYAAHRLASAPTPGPRPETVTAAEAREWLCYGSDVADCIWSMVTRIQQATSEKPEGKWFDDLVWIVAAFASRPPAAAERTK